MYILSVFPYESADSGVIRKNFTCNCYPQDFKQGFGPPYMINVYGTNPTSQKNSENRVFAGEPGLVRMTNRVSWVSGYGIGYAEGAGWEGGGVW